MPTVMPTASVENGHTPKSTEIVVSNLLTQYETTGRQGLVRHLVQMDPSYSNSSMRLKLDLFAFFFRI